MAKKPEVISQEQIESTVLTPRGEEVSLDFNLAQLYGVPTRVLIQAVSRNRKRIPFDFMFQLTKHDLENWRSPFVTSNPQAKMGLRRRHYAFTEQGVAMLSSVLHCEQAVAVNVEIMRMFVSLRKVLAVSGDLGNRLDEGKRRLGTRDEQVVQVVRAIRQIMDVPLTPPGSRIGFRVGDDTASTTTPSSGPKKKRRR